MVITVCISLTALLLSGFTFWFNFLRPPRAKSIFSKTIKFVCSNISNSVSGIHLESTFINPSPRVAVVTKIHLEVNGPDFTQILEPKLFFKYNSIFEAECSGPFHSIVVNPRDSHLENIQFDINGDNFIPKVGKYKFKLCVWINDGKKQHDREFTISIDRDLKMKIMENIENAKLNGKAVYYPIEIKSKEL